VHTITYTRYIYSLLRAFYVTSGVNAPHIGVKFGKIW